MRMQEWHRYSTGTICPLPEIMKANSYAKENSEKFPGFWMNNKLCGVLNVSFDQMSPFLKKIAGIFNFKGDPETGFKQLDNTLRMCRIIRVEGRCSYLLRICPEDCEEGRKGLFDIQGEGSV